MSAKLDKDICIVTLAAGFTLLGASTFAPVTHAQTPPRSGVTPSIQASTIPAAPLQPTTTLTSTNSTTAAADSGDDDDDGPDELMEHWTDPKDIQEQHYQMVGMLVMFAITAGIALRQRAKIRRMSTNEARRPARG